MIALYILIGLAILSVLVVTLRIGRREKISPQVKKKLLKMWEEVDKHDNDNQRVLEAEKVVEMLFREMDIQGSFATKLKTMEAFIPDKEKVWAAHKLRNQIAHEPGFTVPRSDAKHATKAFRKIILKYCS